MTITLLIRRICFVLIKTSLTLSMMLAANAADTIIGQATVIDGDTIEIRSQRIRLSGMDAFETRQTCQDASANEYRCGRDAAFALAALIGQRHVSCVPNGKHWDRVVAICSVGRFDLGAWMVHQGYAVDDRRYEPSYAWSEVLARWTGRGAWSGTFDRPRDWRNQ